MLNKFDIFLPVEVKYEEFHVKNNRNKRRQTFPHE